MSTAHLAYGLLGLLAVGFLGCAGREMSVSDTSNDTTNFPKGVSYILLALACGYPAVVGFHVLHGASDYGEHQLWLSPAALGGALALTIMRHVLSQTRIDRISAAAKAAAGHERMPRSEYISSGLYVTVAALEALTVLTGPFDPLSILRIVMAGFFGVMAVLALKTSRHRPVGEDDTAGQLTSE